MCTGKCSKCIGVVLFPLAVCAIISNILLYFPNGNVTDPNKITDLVWFFHGILGAGILVILPAFMMLGAGGAGCCANRCGMLLSLLLAVLGAAGGVYCVVISSLGLISGPLCDTGDGEYIYPFRNDTLTHQWTYWIHMWHMHEEKKDTYCWNVNHVQRMLVTSIDLWGFMYNHNVLCCICGNRGTPRCSGISELQNIL
uniref:Transmembrane 4 L six family member 1 n=1 Tax=Gopherus agassizii TaxID=38772 RepID=A0A452GG13_9SAUR